VLFELRFWVEVYDEDHLADDDEDDPPFEHHETGYFRDLDNDPDNASAPWWEVETIATVEATTEEAAWLLASQHLRLVARISCKQVTTDVVGHDQSTG
jgi:hypothetical protein